MARPRIRVSLVRVGVSVSVRLSWLRLRVILDFATDLHVTVFEKNALRPEH